MTDRTSRTIVHQRFCAHTRRPRGQGGLGGPHGESVRLGMRICYYNPQEAASIERLEDISAELHSWDVILLSGTCRWAGAEAVQRHYLPNHYVLQFGARKGKWINKSCGLTILISQRIDERSIREIYTPPTSLQGRVAGIRLSTSQYD